MDMNLFLDRYADLILTHGVNLQKDQILNIAVESYGRDFAILIAEKAYKMGAKAVYLDLIDSRMKKIRLQYSSVDNLKFIPDYMVKKYDEFVDKKIASIRLICPEDPDILKHEDPSKINIFNFAVNSSAKRFYEEGIGQSKIAWNISAMATPLWGKKVFPSLTEKEAESALWQEIFKICMVDKENCLDLWSERDKKIKLHAEKLSKMNVKDFHFIGPDTDLHIGICERAFFCGGSEKTDLGVAFEPNIPSEEIFTTPDYRTVNGKVAATRPFLINGRQVKNLKMEFKDGKVIDFSADEGAENFAEYIKADEGASRLGELALVGIDSPIYQSGHIFEEILFDENAACHIALGNGYAFCIDGSNNMTPKELDSFGFNKSSLHTDIMISSEKVDVIATTKSGEEVQIIKNGLFTF